MYLAIRVIPGQDVKKLEPKRFASDSKPQPNSLVAIRILDKAKIAIGEHGIRNLL